MDISYRQSTIDDSKQQRFFARVMPAFALFFLAPFTAEYIIGYLDATGDFFELFFGLAFFAPLYGGAALLIRELTRRSGRSWLTIILLSVAFGIFQAGLVDHSLFSASYLNFEWWGETRTQTYIPLLGISGYYTLIFVVGHIIWSICVPIAIVETFVPNRRTRPWLKNFGLGLTALIYLLMSALIFWDHVQNEQFLPSPPQLIGAFVMVLAFIVVAFMIKKQPELREANSPPDAWRVGVITLFLFNLTILTEIILAIVGTEIQFGGSWVGTVFEALAFTILAGLIWRWSRHKNWNPHHILAIAGAALLTRAWIAYLVEPAGEVALSNKLIHNTAFLIGICVLIYLAFLRTKHLVENHNEKEQEA